MLLPFDAAVDAAVWLQQLRIFLPEALERLNSVALNSHWLDKKVFANLLRAGCFSNIISRLHSVLTEIFGKKTPPAGTKKKTRKRHHLQLELRCLGTPGGPPGCRPRKGVFLDG